MPTATHIALNSKILFAHQIRICLHKIAGDEVGLPGHAGATLLLVVHCEGGSIIVPEGLTLRVSHHGMSILSDRHISQKRIWWWGSIVHALSKAFSMQLSLFEDFRPRAALAFRSQLLKWVGNKQRFAHEIVTYFPIDFGTYYETFLGSGAVLATLSPASAVGSDAFKPLMEIWQVLHEQPDTLKRWYADRWQRMMEEGKIAAYESIRADDKAPNGADLI